MTLLETDRPGGVSPHPIAEQLPAVFADDELAQRWCSGLDDVLSPILAMLDALDAYWDPAVAPVDFLAWLGGWVGVVADQTWPVERQRALIGRAAELYRWQGTARGVAAHVALYLGDDRQPADIKDNGGVSWSSEPDQPLPGTPDPELSVRAYGVSPDDLHRLDAIVAAAKPAHLRHRIQDGGPGAAPAPPAAPPSRPDPQPVTVPDMPQPALSSDTPIADAPPAPVPEPPAEAPQVPPVVSPPPHRREDPGTL